MSLLDLELRENDAQAATLRGYLVALLIELWVEEDGFSGKRPFGNSGWQYEVYYSMADAGLIDCGERDEHNDYDDIDTETADKMILDAIQEIVRGAR